MSQNNAAPGLSLQVWIDNTASNSRPTFLERAGTSSWQNLLTKTGRGGAGHLARPTLTGSQRNKLYISLWQRLGWFRHPQATGRTWSRRSTTSNLPKTKVGYRFLNALTSACQRAAIRQQLIAQPNLKFRPRHACPIFGLTLRSQPACLVSGTT